MRLHTIVELASFVRDADAVLEEEERERLKAFLPANPEAGVLIAGTGGVRKLRWAVQGRGKRGGGRAIYYYHSQAAPLYLFRFYTKAAKSDLSANERRNFPQWCAQLLTNIAGKPRSKENGGRQEDIRPGAH